MHQWNASFVKVVTLAGLMVLEQLSARGIAAAADPPNQQHQENPMEYQ